MRMRAIYNVLEEITSPIQRSVDIERRSPIQSRTANSEETSTVTNSCDSQHIYLPSPRIDQRLSGRAYRAAGRVHIVDQKH